MRPRMLILLFTELAKEPRAYKQIRAFADDFEVTTVGVGSSGVDGVHHVEVPGVGEVPVLLRKILYVLQVVAFRLRWYRASYWLIPTHRSLRRTLAKTRWDVVISHDVTTVPLANRLRPRAGVLVDLHEYAPRQYEHSPEWTRKVAPYYRWICRSEVARARAVVTVSRGIVDEYERQFGFRPHLIVNATPFHEITPTPVTTPIRLVHSGIAAPPRRLEVMIEAVLRTTTDVTLALYLVEPPGSTYGAELRELAADDPRITFPPAVPYEQLVPTLSGYDVGVSIIAATTFNHEYSLPNKFFDYVQARLGIIIGPSPEMAHYVDRYGVGGITRDFGAESLRELLDGLTPETVASWKRASHDHARELSGEVQTTELRGIVDGMLADAGSR